MTTLCYLDLDGNTVVGKHAVTAENPVLEDGQNHVLVSAEVYDATAVWSTMQLDGTFAAPPPPPPPRTVSRLDFMRLFTVAERIAVRGAAAANVALEDWYDLLQATAEVDLDHPDVAAGLSALVGAGLLTSDRAAAIAANEPPS